MATAREHGTLLATAYDLHRFDMLTALRLPLPKTPEQERAMNERLTDFFLFADAFVAVPDAVNQFSVAPSYQHPATSVDQSAGKKEDTQEPGDADEPSGDDSEGSDDESPDGTDDG